MRLFSIGTAFFGAAWMLAAGACIPDANLIESLGGGGAGAGTGTGTGTGAGMGGSASGTGTGTGTGSGTGTGTGMVGCDTPDDCPGTDTTCQFRTCDGGTCGIDVNDEAIPCTEDGGQLCDGLGACVECIVDAHCVMPLEPPCINNICGMLLDDGQPCMGNDECTSGSCADGVCCDASCTGDCESCLAANTGGTDGTCAPAKAGTNPKMACMGNEACFAGSCQSGRVVFTTSMAYDGALGGLVGADALCQTHAMNAGVGGTFMAWLSTATDSPSTRFTQDNVPWRRVDGVIVANSYADLVDGSISAPINLDENGMPPPTVMVGGCDPDLVWTGTAPDGTALDMPENRCMEWTVTNSDGHWGKWMVSTGNWSQYCTGSGGGSCTLNTPLYCFAQ